jgi:hypothetical protein
MAKASLGQKTTRLTRESATRSVVAIACPPPVGGNLREKVTANLFRDNQMRIYIACNGNIYRL